ncbi:MAG: M23 family metallopeptidase [Christensenella sp.]
MSITAGALAKLTLTAANALGSKTDATGEHKNILGSLLGLIGGIILAPAVLLAAFIFAIETLFNVSGIDMASLSPPPVLYEQLGAYPMPCDSSVINSDYGIRDNPMNSVSSESHRGIDFGASWHSPVVAIADGTVSFASIRPSYGRCVFVTYKDGFTARYGHLSKLYVSQGQKVSAGTVLALEGGQPMEDTAVGVSTGHHLHFEIIDTLSDETINPYDYLLDADMTKEKLEKMREKKTDENDMLHKP